MRSVAPLRTLLLLVASLRFGNTGRPTFFTPGLRAAATLLSPRAFFFPGFLSGLGRRHSQWSAALDADFEPGDDVRMEAEFDFVLAERADRMLDVDFALVERDVELRLELVGNHAGRDSPEHLAILAGFDSQDTN